MPRFDCHPTRATWGARCGKSARRVLRGGTGTSDIVARPVPTHHNLDKSWLIQFVEHRVADRQNPTADPEMAQRRGDGGRPVVGTANRYAARLGDFTVACNIYLHHAFDLWVNVWRKKWAQGEVVVVRYADDTVLGFQYQTDADRFLENLVERLKKFGLELHPDKTRRIEFGRFAEQNRRRRGEGKPETFDFLGFTHISGKNRNGDSRCGARRSASAWGRSCRKLNSNSASACTIPCPKPANGSGRSCKATSTTTRYRETSIASESIRDRVMRLWRHSTPAPEPKAAKSTWARTPCTRRSDGFPNLRVLHPYPAASLRRNSSEIRAVCANERSYGSARGAIESSTTN